MTSEHTCFGAVQDTHAYPSEHTKSTCQNVQIYVNAVGIRAWERHEDDIVSYADVSKSRNNLLCQKYVEVYWSVRNITLLDLKPAKNRHWNLDVF
jgi:hypothetical protein